MAAPGIPNWQAQILRGVGAPVTPANLTFLNAWTRAEGGAATNNPFNTTQQAPGASSYNSVNVRNYTSPQQGVSATIQTLLNGHYGNILGALRQGRDARAAATALANSPWGTGSLVEKILGSAPPSSAAQMPVGAPPVAPPPLQQRGSLGQQPALSPKAAAIIASNDRIIGIPTPNLSALTTPTRPQQPVQPPQTPIPNRLPSSSPVPQSPLSAGIAKTALSQIGIPYQWGGQAKLGGRTDCSGLLQASAAANGVHIGRTTYEQWKQGQAVPLDQLQPGDAVFFHPGPQGPQHVAIYIGNGRVVEDPHTGASVEVSTLAGRGAIGARRYL